MSYALGSFLLLLSGTFYSLQRLIIYQSEDRIATVSGMNFFTIILGVLLVPFFGVISAPAVPFLIGSMVAYTGIMIFSVKGYEYSDFSQFEPIQQTFRTLFITLAAIFFFGESINVFHVIAITLLLFSFWIMMDFRRAQKNLSLIIACIVFSGALSGAMLYSFDTLGIRTQEEALTYIVWNLFIGLPTTIYGVVTRTKTITHTLKLYWPQMMATSVLDTLSYGLVLLCIYYLNVVDLLPLLSLQIVMAAVIGVVWLKEPAGCRRILASVLLLISAGILQFFR